MLSPPYLSEVRRPECQLALNDEWFVHLYAERI